MDISLDLPFQQSEPLQLEAQPIEKSTLKNLRIVRTFCFPPGEATSVPLTEMAAPVCISLIKSYPFVPEFNIICKVPAMDPSEI